MTHPHLSHIYPRNRWLFVTWRLHGSLPHSQFPPARTVVDGVMFATVDRYLDSAHSGPLYLRQETIAKIVVRSLLRGEGFGHYQLGAWVMMANHVHVLLLPGIDPSLLLKSLKGATAREANRVLRRTGEPFWQRESYDHYVRNEPEWHRIARYIEWNPVKAGLVAKPERYAWSSANPKYRGSVHMSVNATGVNATGSIRTLA